MESVIDLEMYMLTNKLIKEYNTSCIEKSNESFFPNSLSTSSSLSSSFKNNTKSDTKKPSNKRETPFSGKDALFWCFYIILNGHEKYTLLGKTNIAIEKTEKINCIKKIRENKVIIKKKIKATLTELEDDLVNNPIINIKTLIALAISYNINIMIVFLDKNMFYESINNDDLSKSKVNIITSSSKNDFFLEEDQNLLDVYRTTLYKTENFELKLKSITSYKLEELTNMLSNLNIKLDEDKDKDKDEKGKKKMLKKDVYEKIELFFRRR